MAINTNHKFLVVGCGGSGGKTLRLMMDQLRADLREQGISTMPKAWQFVHVDAPALPDEGPGTLPPITRMGGRYVPVSSSQNSFGATWSQVSSRFQGSSFGPLYGWVPREPREANRIPVSNGAGQYRAVGRMLTLPYLRTFHDELVRAYADLQQPDAWGELNGATDAPVVPIVVSSMAGGAGAGIFLDACRLLARLPGINPADLGVFLYTSDVFGQLPEEDRAWVEGNALGALAEILALVARTGEEQDAAVHAAMGLGPNPNQGLAPLARVFPVGAYVGGDGAIFGDGSMDGIYRGLARALAAIVVSESAANDYVAFKVGNPTAGSTERTHLGWGQDVAALNWGSMGFASLSLGRDRYEEYAAQRISRFACDHLVSGHKQPGVQLPDTDQLRNLVDAQLDYVLQRAGLGYRGLSERDWFLGTAFPEQTADAIAAAGLADLLQYIDQDSGSPSVWLSTVRQRANQARPAVTDRVNRQVYSWAVAWAQGLEAALIEEFNEATARYGLPYARELIRQLRPLIDRYCAAIARAAATASDPVAIGDDIDQQATRLGKSQVSAAHPLSGNLKRSLTTATRTYAQLHAAGLAARILESVGQDVLTALERAATDALTDLEYAMSRTSRESGLATLATSSYQEWPDEGPAPARFDNAFNEVLVTTAKDFPARFQADATTTVTDSQGVYHSAQGTIRYEVLRGRWETAGAAPGNIPVLERRSVWRPAALGHDPETGSPTPVSTPRYHAAATSADVLARARAWLNRPGPFRDFARQSLHDYLNDPHVADAERSARQDGFVRKFSEAMALARPLVGVNPQMVNALHHSNRVIYDYSFSEIGLTAGDPTAIEVQTMLANNSSLNSTTVDHFNHALATENAPRTIGQRIAMFGSYQKYSPLAFSSLLRPIKQRWEAGPPDYLLDIWKWKRTRSLPAAIGMSPPELEAVIAGWYLGRALGLVRQPVDVKTSEGLAVFSIDTHQWLEIHHLLTSRDRLVLDSVDWLPAVLGSHALAIVMSNNDPTLSALAPYRTLRQIFDDGSDPQLGSDALLSSAALIGDWYRTGAWPSGQPSEVLTDPGTAEGRKDELLGWLDETLEWVGETLDTRRRWARSESIAEATAQGLFEEVAPLVFAALERLRRVADQVPAEVGSSRPTRGGRRV